MSDSTHDKVAGKPRLGSWSFGEHRVRFPRFLKSRKSARAIENEIRAIQLLLKVFEGNPRAIRGQSPFIKGNMVTYLATEGNPPAVKGRPRIARLALKEFYKIPSEPQI